MKTLELNQMEIIHAGDDCMNCGAAVIAGAMMGSWFFGGVGAAIGAALVGLGPNCLDLQDTGNCDE